jgi:hypothetical protein
MAERPVDSGNSDGDAPEDRDGDDGPEQRSVVSRMEAAFGASFRGVRLHTDEAAAAKAAALHARAYTDGQEIGFARGQFAPATPQGLHTIAHEFAHVLQARGGSGGHLGTVAAAVGSQGVRTQPEDGPATDAVEEDADAAATAVVSGERPLVAGGDGVLAVLTKGDKETDALLTPPPGKYIVVELAGTYYYLFNTRDVKGWSDWLDAVLTRYFQDLFAGNVTELTGIAREYRATQDVPITSHGSIEKWTKPWVKIAVTGNFHGRVLAWMATHYPNISFKARATGERPLAPRTPGGSKEGIVQFDPVGKLVLTPDLPSYVVESDVNAHVAFDESDPNRMMLNYFPKRATFEWAVRQGTTPVAEDDGDGEIDYTFSLDDPGTYTLEVTVTSRYFTADKRLALSRPIIIVKEAARQQEVFENLLVGKDDPNKPFERDATGALKLKAGIKELTVQEEINELNIQIGAIKKMADLGKLPQDVANSYLKYFDEQQTSLDKIREQTKGTDPYVVRGTFLNREDSTSFSLRLFMQRTNRTRANGKPTYEVALYDSTLTPGAPVQHTGSSSAETAPNEAKGYAAAEQQAIDAMASHWHTYNDYPYGTVHLAIKLLEDGTIIEKTIDTYNVRRTGRKVLTGLAVAGGLILLAASPLTGGASAPVAVLILDAAVAGATIALVADSINQRIQTGTFKFDAQFVLDMLTVVTVVLGAFGTFARALTASQAVKNGMLLANLGTGAASLVLISVETRQTILGIEARYTAEIAGAQEAVTAAQDDDTRKKAVARVRQLEQQRDAAIAQILGAAAVSGGLILVSMGMSAKQLAAAPAAGAKGGVPPGETPPPPPPSRQGSGTDVPPAGGGPVVDTPPAGGPAAVTDVTVPAKQGTATPPASTPTAGTPPANTPSDTPPATLQTPPKQAVEGDPNVPSTAAPQAQAGQGTTSNTPPATPPKQAVEGDPNVPSTAAPQAQAGQGTTATTGPNPGKGPQNNPNKGWGRGQIPCFPAGTPVATPDGMRPIESLRVGDAVCAYDFQAHTLVNRTVLALYHGSTEHWVDVAVGSQVVRTTRWHPFWVESAGTWIDALELAPGMTVLLQDGSTSAISQVSILGQGESQQTYNLHVEQVNNFFAGIPGVLVHNAGPAPNDGGFSNYHLEDASGKIYYEGHFGPNETAAKVTSRHANYYDRFDPAKGDKMVPEPGTRTYGESVRMEHERCVQYGTFIGKDPKTWRGNRIYPMDSKKFPRYYRPDAC